MVTSKKFFGIMGYASEFLKELTLLETLDYGWTERYLDPKTKNHWLKYMIDRDKGYYYNLMLLTPKPMTDEMIEIAFSSPYPDEVEGAAHRLFLEEEENKNEFRSKIIEKLETCDLSQLSNEERKRIKTIIVNCHLTDKINKREIIGKHLFEIEKDADFFRQIAEYSEQVLQLIK